MHWLGLLPGIIWSGFMGLALGNFATNPIYRLPRQESLFGKDPYCGDCDAKLMPKDLFPVLSWLMTRGRCRYCGASVPGAYTVTEALIGLLYVLCYLKFGFCEYFLLAAFGMTAFVMLGMMLTIDNFFSDRTLFAAIACGMVMRTLEEHTIYGFTSSAFMGMIAGAVAWKLSRQPMIRDAVAFPGYLKLLVAAGVWLPQPYMLLLLALTPLSLPLRRHLRWVTEWMIIALTLYFTIIRNIA